eukprot:COSAG06_NODE_20814_length_780_cov_1.038179_2_plen_184_part_01
MYEMAVTEKRDYDVDDADAITDLRELFDQFDADGSKKIDITEITAIVLKIDPRTTSEEIDALFRKADADNCGGICFDEFLAAVSDEPGDNDEVMRLDLGLLVKKKAQYNIRDNASSRLFLLVFLLYPSLTNKILEGFVCRKIGEDASVLHVDYAMNCDNSTEFWAMRFTSVVLTALWPIGVPAF